MALEEGFHVAIINALHSAELEERNADEVALHCAWLEEPFHVAIRNALHCVEVEEQNGDKVALHHARHAWLDAEQFEEQQEQYADQMALEGAFHLAMRFLRN